jgi:hypothetical protein
LERTLNSLALWIQDAPLQGNVYVSFHGGCFGLYGNPQPGIQTKVISSIRPAQVAS